MGLKSNVIDMTSRRKEQLGRREVGRGDGEILKIADIVDLTEKRQNLVKTERRKNRRTIVSEGFGGFVVVPERGLLEVNLFDIQKEGISFDSPIGAGKFREGQVIAMRIYINQTHYFPLNVEIKHITAQLDEGTNRHGTQFAKEAHSADAVDAFVKFVESVSPLLRFDSGDLKIPSTAR